MLSRNLLIILPLMLAACAQAPAYADPARPTGTPLKIASWNLEFLAERNGDGCTPRNDADYAAMRNIVDKLDADVIAFQEAENEAAAARVFDPQRYAIVMETRPGAPSGTCGGAHPEQRVIRQAVGFAIRKDIKFDRHADVSSLSLGNAQLRSGVDITLKATGSAPIRLLAIHLKSGCFAGNDNKACPTLFEQLPALESWIDAAAAGPTRFAVLGDWNRRLALAGDSLWTEIDDGEPANADLRLADEGIDPGCDPRYTTFIDHIVLDKRTGQDMQSFAEVRYGRSEKHYSDHCPIMVTLRQ